MNDKELEKLVKRHFPSSYDDFKTTRNAKNYSKDNYKNTFNNKSAKKHVKRRISPKIRMKKIVFLIAACLMLVISILLYNESTKKIIVLDPGHGGHDTGALSNDETRYEKDDNLALALLTKEFLAKKLKTEKQGNRYKIVLTRSDDRFISLAERCKVANSHKAILFVSFHRNSLSKKIGDAKGIEVWINNYNNESENKLANELLDNLASSHITENRGIKTGTTGNKTINYYVNEHTNMKSVILEMGFITNELDNQYFDNYMNEYANAIANAIYEDSIKDLLIKE